MSWYRGAGCTSDIDILVYLAKLAELGECELFVPSFPKNGKNRIILPDSDSKRLGARLHFDHYEQIVEHDDPAKIFEAMSLSCNKYWAIATNHLKTDSYDQLSPALKAHVDLGREKKGSTLWLDEKAHMIDTVLPNGEEVTITDGRHSLLLHAELDQRDYSDVSKWSIRLAMVAKKEGHGLVDRLDIDATKLIKNSMGFLPQELQTWKCFQALAKEWKEGHPEEASKNLFDVICDRMAPALQQYGELLKAA